MRQTLTLASLLLLAPPLLLADVVYEMDTKVAATSATSRNTIEIGGGNMRMDFAEQDRNGSMIFRGDRRSLLILDHDSKTWFELDQATMEQLGATMNDAMKQMEEALKNVPESQRAMVEKMMKEQMGGQMPTAPEREPLEFSEGGSGSVAGYGCREVQVSRGGRRLRDVCVTDWGSIEGGDEAATVMKSMSEFLEELVDTLAGSGPFARMFEMNRGAFEGLQQLNGLPISAVEYDEQGEVERESTLVSATARSVGADRFDPPDGYKKQEMRPGN